MAEQITVNIPHRLTRAEVRGRIDSGFVKVQEQIVGKGVDVDQSWVGDQMDFTLSIMGQSISGKLLVEDERVQITIDLPWLLARFGSTIREKLTKGTKLLLDKK